MDELIEVHGRLLTLERECELERASSDVLLLQRRDARLVVERIDRSSGLGGRVTVAMKRRSDLPLALGRIGVGDVVAIRPVAPLESAANASTLPRGVVAKLSDLSVTVVLDDSEHDDSDSAFVVAENASVFLVRLANDVTYTRLREALAELPSMRQSRVARVCFGETEPHQLGERDSELRVLDAGLNASQIDAVRFALASSDVAVIHGPPGTGKTTTVVELVRQLVLRRRRVLVCAPSNTAVDNLLAKLAPCMMRGELKLSRVGHAARVSEALLPFSLDNAVLQSDDMGLARDIRADIARVNARLTTARGGERRALNGELRALRSDVRKRERLAKARTLASCDVVLATCVGAGSRGFRAAAASATVHDGVVAAATTAHERKPFDVVIIDEAAQALELSCWIPIALGSRVVLAGDHLQLPPTIFSEEAARGGLSTTLVDRVVKRWGDRCTRC
jgi:ATP-dependent RNA/DNA helicase IGHMBP2